MNDGEKNATGIKLSYLLPLLIIVIYTVWQLYAGGGHSITTEVDDTQIGLAVDRYEAVFIPLKEVLEMSLVETLDDWNVEKENSEKGFLYGNYSNEEHGDVWLSVWLSKPPFIVVQTEDMTYIYNHPSVKETNKDYAAIMEALSKIA